MSSSRHSNTPPISRTPTADSDHDSVKFSIDLVSAARKNLGFLRDVSEAQWLHEESTLLEAVRRYDELWMPLIADLAVDGSMPPMVLPPFDVEWVWFCHTLDPVSYRQYCISKFAKLIGKPAIFDKENEEYALIRCKELWIRKYSNETFENEVDANSKDPTLINQNLVGIVCNQKKLHLKFSEPYQSEVVYLIAARQRYKRFLHLLQDYACSRLVPPSDVLLMWLSHQSYPTVYAGDVKQIEGQMGKVVALQENVNQAEVEEAKDLWERTFDEPHERAGGMVAIDSEEYRQEKMPIYWGLSDVDDNTKYKSMLPRFLNEVCIFIRRTPRTKSTQVDISRESLCLRMLRCHRELKMREPISKFPLDSWRKFWHLFCEFGTRGVVIELRHHGSSCFKRTSNEETVTFLWNDLLRAPSLSVERSIDQQVRIFVSITPPVQAPYLLKCVPDRVTDDSGTMISDVILKMNGYRPQEGRWLSRTVLDHAGRECFVVRMRVGEGFWRRGGETPSVVKWDDRIIEIREGSWTYVAGSIGRAPVKVVGTATPQKSSEELIALWSFSTGDELTVQWDSSLSISSLRFHLKTHPSSHSLVKLLKGRQMQYKVRSASSNGQSEEQEEYDNEDGFVTIVRYTEEDPIGKATALMNWKLLVVELLPEEDAVLVLLLCTSMLRIVSEMRKEDIGGLSIRRRVKEIKLGDRDWGSVMLHPSCSPPVLSPYLQPWYSNAKTVMASDRADYTGRQPTVRYSQVDGGERLYRIGILN